MIAQSSQKIIIQTVGKAALKTFLQAAIAILVLLAIPQLTSWADVVRNGGTIDIDVDWWLNVFYAAAGGGIAALLSAVWNWSKTPTKTPVVVDPPAAVE